ncbi:hypothetical protein D3C86_1189390 [compost metagenome]
MAWEGNLNGRSFLMLSDRLPDPLRSKLDASPPFLEVLLLVLYGDGAPRRKVMERYPD